MGTCQTWETTTSWSHTNHLWPGSSLTFAMFIWSPKTSRPLASEDCGIVWQNKIPVSRVFCHGPSTHGPGFTTPPVAHGVSDAHQSRNEELDRPGNPGDSSWMTSLGLVTHAHCRRRRKKETWHESSELNQWEPALFLLAYNACFLRRLFCRTKSKINFAPMGNLDCD